MNNRRLELFVKSCEALLFWGQTFFVSLGPGSAELAISGFRWHVNSALLACPGPVIDSGIHHVSGWCQLSAVSRGACKEAWVGCTCVVSKLALCREMLENFMVQL